MSTENINLNLTRKWRSKNFDQIVGQELSVRMLKNSLYLKQFFPVYLFSGQRGCGKTSTARVFASAVNCSKLSLFQKDPRKHTVPCLTCDSCKAMLSGNHPDFIEIDAASHTGVDNVRQIIESSSFMPLMGKKRVYLIDEAHMLSKAAFNAFLKILEEPPSSVIFILATTNLQKIIETVRSRCFQLFFKPVEYANLVDHLTNVCSKEDIPYDESGLDIIARESQGSVRDSLNLLEQVRFSSGSISRQSVQNILGHIDDERLLHLFELLLQKGPQEVLSYLKELKYEFFSAQYLWKKLIEIVRMAIWIKHGVDPSLGSFSCNRIGVFVKHCSWDDLHNIMQLFYDNEAVFTKTTEKHSLLEMILIQISKKNDISNNSGASSSPQEVTFAQKEEEQEDVIIEEEEEVEIEEDAKNDLATDKSFKPKGSSWDKFLSSLDGLKDPLLASIFKNGEVVRFDVDSGDLEVLFLKQFSFFKESLQEAKDSWMPLLRTSYAENVNFKPLFTKEGAVQVKKSLSEKSNKNNTVDKPFSVAAVSLPKRNNNAKFYQPAFNRVKHTQRGAAVGKLIDVSDVVAWKKANILLKYFAGSVREVRES